MAQLFSSFLAVFERFIRRSWHLCTKAAVRWLLLQLKILVLPVSVANDMGIWQAYTKFLKWIFIIIFLFLKGKVYFKAPLTWKQMAGRSVPGLLSNTTAQEDHIHLQPIISAFIPN